MKTLNRSVLASAVLLAMSAPVLAADYGVARTGFLPVLSQEMFGVIPGESNGLADSILVKMPTVITDLDTAVGCVNGTPTDACGDNFAAVFAAGDPSTYATMQFTLNAGVTWGEDLSTTQKFANANGGNGVLTGTVFGTGLAAGHLIPSVDAAGRPITDALYSYKGVNAVSVSTVAAAGSIIVFDVIQGGSPSDNNLTLRFRKITTAEAIALEAGAAVAGNIWLNDFTFGDAQLNDLVEPLNQNSSNKRVRLSNEYTAATSGADALANRETVTGSDILASGPTITVNATDLDTTGLPRISVAANQLLFTNTVGSAALTDFDDSDDLNYVNLGNLQIRRTRVGGAAGVGIDHVVSGATTQIIFGEDLNEYSFTGDDVVTLTLKNLVLPTDHPYQAGGFMYLDENGADCSDGANALLNGTTERAVINQAAGTATFTLTGNSTDNIEGNYQLCFVANGADRIPVQPDVIAADGYHNPINARYDNSRADDEAFGPLLLNGCTASFFNIPLSNNVNSDLAYVRLSNTSSQVSAGGVTGVLYRMDGSAVTGTNTDANGEFPIGTEIAQHGTLVYTSGPTNLMNGSDVAAYSIQAAAGFDPAAIDATGVERLRLVVTGAFPVCEGLGLIRTANGNVVNMTATTQGNGDAQTVDTADNRGNNQN